MTLTHRQAQREIQFELRGSGWLHGASKGWWLMHLLLAQMFLPASVFIVLEEEDCCGCCGYDNCGKSCAVGLVLGGGAGLHPQTQPHSLPMSTLPPDALFCAGSSGWHRRIRLLCHRGRIGFGWGTPVSEHPGQLELHLCQHRRTVSHCSWEAHTFLSTVLLSRGIPWTHQNLSLPPCHLGVS